MLRGCCFSWTVYKERVI